MTKPLHPGAAARAGSSAALLAKHGYTASPRALEAPRGLLRTYSAKCDWREITEGLGERFEIAYNTYKPFACGVVIHPAIDGCVQLREAHGLRPAAIERVELQRAPARARAHRQDDAAHGPRGQVQRLPRLRGRARCSGARAKASSPIRWSRRADLVALRERIHAVVDPAIAEDAADVAITLNDGRTLHLRSSTPSAASGGRWTTPRSRASFTGSPTRCSAPSVRRGCANGSRSCRARPTSTRSAPPRGRDAGAGPRARRFA